jgi:hypothetical protein
MGIRKKENKTRGKKSEKPACRSLKVVLRSLDEVSVSKGYNSMNCFRVSQ